ncbi:synaptonemal complex central element protein 2 isoform X1 [Gambusia affinis]|uniref:synaptonemal complex central element protein 2 isoform X1 n=1 Tax=Gambusia affinis TaxID=33528 RepID=UPI001CDC8601|nr:synaptonemal complex central element protein 2 isoform X1 [Gambusia affinis]
MVRQANMDFFFDDLPASSLSTPKKGHEDSLMVEDTDCDLSRNKSSSVSMTEIQEHHGSSYIDDISKRAQEMVEKLNHERTRDQEMMDSFQKQLTEKVTEMCQLIKEEMFTIYELNSNEIQVKLQELSEVLENCSKLEHELLEASQALACLKDGLDINQRAEP